MTYGYTMFCAVALALTFGLEAILKTGLLRDRRFWITVAIVGFFQLVVDGWLTCRPIVTYEAAQFSGIRFGCGVADPWPRAGRPLGMPLEDLAFGFAMITQGLQWWIWWGRRLRPKDVPEERLPASLRVD
ncbi:lycopene cyclase domain-containing protein [soil metagenome]